MSLKAKTTRSISIYTQKNQVPDSNWDANRFVEVCTELSSLTPEMMPTDTTSPPFLNRSKFLPVNFHSEALLEIGSHSRCPNFSSSSCSACDLPQSKHTKNRRAAARGRRTRRPEDGGVSSAVQAGVRRMVRISRGPVRHWSRVIQRIMADRACSTARD